MWTRWFARGCGTLTNLKGERASERKRDRVRMRHRKGRTSHQKAPSYDRGIEQDRQSGREKGRDPATNEVKVLGPIRTRRMGTLRARLLILIHVDRRRRRRRRRPLFKYQKFKPLNQLLPASVPHFESITPSNTNSTFWLFKLIQVFSCYLQS